MSAHNAELVAAGDRLAVALREALRRLGEEAQSRIPWAEDALLAWDPPRSAPELNDGSGADA